MNEWEFILEDELIGKVFKAQIVDVQIAPLVEFIPKEKIQNPKHMESIAVRVVAVGPNGERASTLIRLPRDKVIRKNSKLYRFIQRYRLPANPQKWKGSEVEIRLVARRNVTVWEIVV